MISVIIVQYDNAHLTRNAVESFRHYVTTPHEIIVVDNASPDISARKIGAELKDVRFIASETNLGFSRANNLAATGAKGDLLLFLNSDTVTQSDFVAPMEEEFRRDAGLGAAGPRLLNEDGSFQLSAGELPSVLVEARDKILAFLLRHRIRAVTRAIERKFARQTDVEWLTGAALFVRTEAFRAVNGFDEKLFMFFEDKDLCLRVRKAGYAVRYFPQPALVHLLGGSSSRRPGRIRKIYRESQEKYYRKHRPWIEQQIVRAYAALRSGGEAE
jgi:hypothetical protein